MSTIRPAAMPASFMLRRLDLRVTVPIHNKTLPTKTLKSILKQADLTEDEFLKLREGK